jgi:fibronectin-binding autotransporter adhesin
VVAGSFDNIGTVTGGAGGTSGTGAGGYGEAGVYADGGAVITNSGTIAGGAGGAAGNDDSPVGGDGARFVLGGTLINAGVFLGANGADAVAFDGGYVNRVVIDPGATFTGKVNGGNALGGKFISTLELASGSSTTTLTGLGTTFVGFADIVIDAKASWVIGTLTAGESLTNQGTLAAPITLLAGSYLLNDTGGTIVGSGKAAVTGTTGAVSVVNAGTIDPATYGVYLTDGGTVTNVAGGLIEGTAEGVRIAVAPGTIVNQGTIKVTSGIGVYLRDGGTLTNGGSIIGSATAASFGTGTARLILDHGASFSGKVVADAALANVLELAGTVAGTLSSFDSQFTGFGQVTIDGGASWTLASTDTFGSGVTLTNSGTLTGPVTLRSGGYLDNAAGGTIVGSGTAAVLGTTGAVLVVNAGTIDPAKYGIYLTDGGTVTNVAGLIEGTTAGVRIALASGTVVNDATIKATSGIGVYLRDGGTLTNAGSVIGSTTAVSFGTAAGRLILDPGASFSGKVVADAVLTNVLELASSTGTGALSSFGSQFTGFAQVTIDSGARWTFAGTDTVGIGVSLTNSGTLSGSATLLSGAVLDNTPGGMIAGSGLAAVYGKTGAVSVLNAGVIDPATYGVDLTDGGTVFNASAALIEGTSAGVRITGAAGTVTNDATIEATTGAGAYLQDGGTLTNAGSIIGSGGADAVNFGTGAARLILDPGASFSGAVVADATLVNVL